MAFFISNCLFINSLKLATAVSFLREHHSIITTGAVFGSDPGQAARLEQITMKIAALCRANLNELNWLLKPTSNLNHGDL